jgi:hypothetical protein
MWNQLVTHSLMQERERWREHSLHRIKLQRIRKRRGQSSQPYSPTRNLKKERLEQEKAVSIQRENELLLQKIVNIDFKSGKSRHLPLLHSLNRRTRIQELTKISRENQTLLTRLKRTQSSYSVKRWAVQSDTLSGIRNRLSQNAGRIPRTATYDSDNFDPFVLPGELLRRRRMLRSSSSVEGRRGRSVTSP